MFTLRRTVQGFFLLSCIIFLYHQYKEVRVGSPYTPSTSHSIMSDPLVDWVKEHLTSLYQKSTESSDDALPGLLAATFKSNAHIIYNHQRIDLTTFGDNINKSFFAVTRADVEWKEAVALPNDESEGEKQVGTRLSRADTP